MKGEGRQAIQRAHRPILERLEDFSPQLGIALVLLDEAFLLGRKAVRLQLGFLGCPFQGPGTSPASS